MALVFMQMILSLLFALALFHKIYKRSVSTFIVFTIGFLWTLLDSFGWGDYGLWIVSSGLVFMYWRAMQKSPIDTII